MSRKAVGRAVAIAVGYYPDDGAHCRLINPGEEFDVVEGLEHGAWFERTDEVDSDEEAQADEVAVATGNARKARARKVKAETKAEAATEAETPPEEIA